MPVFAFLLFAVAAGHRPPPAREALMNRIERIVKLPAGSAALAGYERVYTMLTAQNAGLAAPATFAPRRPKVLAIYSVYGGKHGRRWETGLNLPMVADGGCGHVTIVYDIASDAIESARCNDVG
jgi:hypothetical protein